MEIKVFTEKDHTAAQNLYIAQNFKFKPINRQARAQFHSNKKKPSERENS